MTGKHTANLYIDGTSALKLASNEQYGRRAAIIPFPSHAKADSRMPQSDDRKNAKRAITHSSTIFERLYHSVFATSEMLCSLLLEDVRGCPYRMFSRRDIALASASAALIAIASIAFGC